MDAIPADRQEGMPQVDPAGLADDALILDVRDPADYAAGHAPGSVNIPLAQLVTRWGEVPVAADGGVVPVSCGGGSKQTRAVAYLRAKGLDVVVLKGGMRAWRSAGRPIIGGSTD